MARVPLIDSPCPLRATSMPSAGRDHCGHCDRQVHNLDGMNTAQREAFLKSCTGKVCVAYTVHRRATGRNAAIGATLVASLAGSGMAMAQQAPAQPPAPTAQAPLIDITATDTHSVLATEQAQQSSMASAGQTFLTVTVGGINDASQARWADQSELSEQEQQALPEIDELEWLPSKAR
jgi:hypothetical protein